MQTLEREPAAPGVVPSDLESPGEPRGSRRSGRPSAIRVETVLKWTVAAAMLGAAGIHFGMMGEHAGVSWTHGLFFAATAWAQVALAALVILRPSRPVALAGIALNLAILGVWIVTRTVGLAIGGDGTPEAWGTVDGVCAAFEAVAVLGCLGLLARGFARRPLSTGVGVAGIAFAGVLVAVVTALVFSPAFLAGASSGSGLSADGHNHGGGSAAAAGHTHGAPVDDKGLAALSNGHHHAIGPEQPLNATDRAVLSQQIAGSVEVAKRYPTVAAATAAGFTRAGPFVPGLGAHYIKASVAALNVDGVVDATDADSPMSIIYDGVTPDAKVAGFMYYAMTKDVPEGFAGPNDIWHFHTNVCLKYGSVIDAPFGADTTVSKAMCDGVGGTLMDKTAYMVHVWSVPGWESQQGLFGEVNPALSCPDGSYYMWPKKTWADHLDNVCRSA